MIHELALHTTTTSPIARVLGAAAWTLAIVSASASTSRPASAQGLCEQEDAGLCEDDGGVDTPPADAGSDAGSSTGGDGGIVRRDGGASGGEGIACSCHTDTELERGARIHVCTESSDPDVCLGFDCERGTVRDRGCPSDGVRLCCVMRSRDLSTSLYDDCTHPNCESGFREQCREFGGTVSTGACEGAVGGGGSGSGDIDDDDGSMCAVGPAPGGRPGSQSGRAPAIAALVLALLASSFIRRSSAARRARRPQSRSRPT